MAGQVADLRAANEVLVEQIEALALKLARLEQQPWGSKEKYPSAGSGRLKIEICGYSSSSRQSRWADRTKWT